MLFSAVTPRQEAAFAGLRSGGLIDSACAAVPFQITNVHFRSSYLAQLQNSRDGAARTVPYLVDGSGPHSVAANPAAERRNNLAQRFKRWGRQEKWGESRRDDANPDAQTPHADIFRQTKRRAVTGSPLYTRAALMLYRSH